MLLDDVFKGLYQFGLQILSFLYGVISEFEIYLIALQVKAAQVHGNKVAILIFMIVIMINMHSQYPR